MARSASSGGFWSSKPKVVTPPPRPYHAPNPHAGAGAVIDATTIISLLCVVALLVAAYAASLRLLPKSASIKTRILFVWHAFDALIHFFFEGSFLYNCFFVSYSLPTSFDVASRRHPRIKLLTPPDVYWMGREDRLYGASYGEGPFSRLWQEYSKADRRWGGVDLGIVSLEFLTVFVGAPLACELVFILEGTGDDWAIRRAEGRLLERYVLMICTVWCCELLRREERKGVLKRWFWMMILATAEIYGGMYPPIYSRPVCIGTL